MVYRNKKTGAVIETICTCGGEWEPVTEKKEEKEPKETKKKGKKSSE